jgi:hypothetical protein
MTKADELLQALRDTAPILRGEMLQKAERDYGSGFVEMIKRSLEVEDVMSAQKRDALSRRSKKAAATRARMRVARGRP